MRPPNISIKPKEPLENMGGKEWSTYFALFIAQKNEILLGKRVNDGNIEIFLSHELAHWATIYSLCPKERKMLIRKPFLKDGIIERIALWTEFFYAISSIIEYPGSLEEVNKLKKREFINDTYRPPDYRCKILVESCENSSKQLGVNLNDFF